jgi:hypothetical protein
VNDEVKEWGAFEAYLSGDVYRSFKILWN